MHKERTEPKLPIIWTSTHIVAIVLAFIKLFGGLQDWAWPIVLAPFILDITMVVALIFGVSILCFLSAVYRH